MPASKMLAPVASSSGAARLAAGGRAVAPCRRVAAVRRPALVALRRASGAPSSGLQVVAHVAHPGEEGSREGQQNDFDAALRVPTTMAKGLGSFGGATMERSKLDMSQKVQNVAPKVDDSGGGGNNGGKIFNGGGGDGGDGDDDDYFDDFEEGDGDGDGDGFFRVVVPELYDAITVNAVLAEWFRTVADLPLILRQAVQMGLLSSAQLVRFLSMDVRPGVARAVTRTFSPDFAREFVGRLMADPAFAQKLLIEQTITAGGSLYWEWRQRRENFIKELDLVACNTLTLCAANAALVWSVAPNRSYGAPNKLPWQQLVSGLPNNVFDRQGPLRQYSNTKRAAGFFTKAAELSAIGVVAGAAQAGIAKGLVALRKTQNPQFEPTVPVPSISQSSMGMGAFMGLSSNLRYQLIGGADRYLFDHSNFLWSYLTVSSVLRSASQYIGNGTRVLWQGLPTSFPSPQQRRTAPVRKVRKVRKVKKVVGPDGEVKRVPVAGSGGFEMSASAPGAGSSVAPPVAA